MSLPKNYLSMAQNTPEWLMARCGLVTSSRIADIVKKRKDGKPVAARHNYLMDKVTEVLTGRSTDNYVSQAMEFGIDNEPLARTAYELSENVEVASVGFVLHPKLPRCGASPDGLIGDDGLVEFKVPNTATHLEYIFADEVPDEYKPQMMWQMACAERDWCDFCSYDPRVPQEFSLFIKRFERDNLMIIEMEKEVVKFITEMNVMCERLKVHAQAKARLVGPGPQASEIPDAAEWIGRTQ